MAEHGNQTVGNQNLGNQNIVGHGNTQNITNAEKSEFCFQEWFEL